VARLELLFCVVAKGRDTSCEELSTLHVKSEPPTQLRRWMGFEKYVLRT